MIRAFEVSNFKGFKDKIVFDLSKARDYSFNTNLVENGIVKKGLVYGKNGTGKSNLGLALYDLTIHLTDKQKPNDKYFVNYINLDNKDEAALFKYEFEFDNEIYTYTYGKLAADYLTFEKLVKGNEILIDYEYSLKGKKIVNISEAKTLSLELKDNKLSILKFIYKNTPTNNNPISKIVRFAEGMLWFRCLDDGNSFIGLMNGGVNMDDLIISNNKIEDFEKFLKENDLDYHFVARNFNGQNVLMAVFDNGEASFSTIASTGTKALWLYYCWSLFFENISFLFLDEFDAFYHFESSEYILKAINDSKMQSIVTSHNTYLMKNSITRPDCCFVITEGNITALCDCTEKEIREAHNLEKMYRNGTFTE